MSAIRTPQGAVGPRHHTRVTRSVAALAVVALASLPIVGASAAQAPVDLGTAGSFAVLAGSGITNTGPTTITGDVGTFPTTSMTGFGSVTLNGTNHAGDAVTQQAKTDLTTAYNTAAGATPTTAVPTELGGRTLTPGVYGGPTLGITGTLTLNTLGDPDAVFIFQAGSTLITAADSAVVVLGGGTACNVFWQVGSSATLGARTSLIGTVLAATSISAGTGATVQGRLLASDGAVTLDTNTITRTSCAPPAPPPPPPPPPAPTTTTTVAGGTTTTTAPGGTTSTTILAATGPGSPTTPGATPSAPLASPTGGLTGEGVTGGPSGDASAAGSPGDATGGGAGRSGSPGTPSGPGGPGSPGGGTPGLDLTGGTPDLALTGTNVDAFLVGLTSLAVGSLLMVGARLRRRSANDAA